MNILIKKELAEAIGKKNLEGYGINWDQWRWSDNKGQQVDLAKFSPMKVIELQGMVEEYVPTVKSARVVLRDIKQWISAVKEAPDEAKIPNTKTFSDLLTKFLKKVEGPRVYQHDKVRGLSYAYYAESVRYTPEKRGRGWVNPDYTTLRLLSYEFGQIHETSFTFYTKDVKGKIIPEILANEDLYIETPALRAEYQEAHEAYKVATEQIGKQYFARGRGTDDLDGNPKKDTGGSYWWREKTNDIQLDKNGDPSQVVIDVYKESDKEQRTGYSFWDERDDYDKIRLDPGFWARARATTTDEDGDVETDTDILVVAAEEAGENVTAMPEIPTHPTVAVFDLKRHLRLKVDITQLEEYQYNHGLGEKLVLPGDNRTLVDILLAHKEGAFKDVIAGKGAGAVILCAGPPGTGKTLTAEAYAEVSERPLYTVQCSQLGTTADELEDELLKIFARAERWGAIALLDEADVYIRQRGDDLAQNAIVGVFLRTLEYYKGTMFMTTNRLDMVDDAVASRCIARIEYDVPSAPDQIKIWQNLSKENGARLKDATIKAIAKEFPRLSGRDVKNLLKLAMLISAAKNEDITIDTIRFVKRFKPTSDAAA